MQPPTQMPISPSVQPNQPCPIHLARGQVYFHPANQCRIHRTSIAAVDIYKGNTLPTTHQQPIYQQQSQRNHDTFPRKHDISQFTSDNNKSSGYLAHLLSRSD